MFDLFLARSLPLNDGSAQLTLFFFLKRRMEVISYDIFIFSFLLLKFKLYVTTNEMQSNNKKHH